jgi:hypothetical protein
MNHWSFYPATYRQAEVQRIVAAALRGDSTAVIGLSGAGKSNLLGFLVRRIAVEGLEWKFLDGNRLRQKDVDGFLQLIGEVLGCGAGLMEIEQVLMQHLKDPKQHICLVIDRFDALPQLMMEEVAGNLRALRDTFKYQLSYVIGARRPPLPNSELAELFFANTLWLGPLTHEDGLWSVAEFARRAGLDWPVEVQERIYALSGGYASFLRATCEAYAAGAELDENALRTNSLVRARLEEFWNDAPGADVLRLCGVENHPWLSGRGEELTALEYRLLAALQAHVGQVCQKDDLIRAVWSEDRVFERGVRDDSLAQLVRRLRQKIGEDAIQTLPGRGYRLVSK